MGSLCMVIGMVKPVVSIIVRTETSNCKHAVTSTDLITHAVASAVAAGVSGGVGRLKQMEEFRSNTIYNEDSPRYCFPTASCFHTLPPLDCVAIACNTPPHRRGCILAVFLCCTFLYRRVVRPPGQEYHLHLLPLVLLYRWNEKFDFIMVPASSVLLITVWDQTSVMESVASLSLSKVSAVPHLQ